jgi:cytidylate kinase
VSAGKPARPGAQHLVIAIDGPAASGKSSTARRVAERLGIHHADSGVLYRAVTLARLRAGGEPPWPEDSVLAATAGVTCLLSPGETSWQVRVLGHRADEEVHGPAVSGLVSHVAQMLRVRSWVNEQMRSFAARGPLVVDGRDMGTAVFPDARLKIFLDAHPTVRARRRSLQQLDRLPSVDELAAETERLTRRDEHDATQTRKAPDAIVIDTTHLTQDEQVAQIAALAKGVRQG